MNTDSEYRQRADQHRPAAQDAITAAMQRMQADGLKPRDMASILGIGLGAVLQALGHWVTALSPSRHGDRAVTRNCQFDAFE